MKIESITKLAHPSLLFGSSRDVQVVDNNKRTNHTRLEYAKNPIRKSGEISNTLLATVCAGVVFGARLLLMIADDGEGAEFLCKMATRFSKKIAENNSSANKLTLVNKIGGPIAFIGVVLLGLAAIYTIYNLPKILYTSKVNTFKKSKTMDVYIKGNAVEKELYEQMNAKAKVSSDDEKAELRQQYAMLKASKNLVPDFVVLKQPNLEAQQK